MSVQITAGVSCSLKLSMDVASISGAKLRSAARDGNTDEVVSCLQRGADINYKDSFGWTALHRAAVMGRDRMVEVLVEGGGDINVQDRGGMTALHNAAQYGHDRIIEVLVEGGGDVNVQNRGGYTALHVAAIKGHDRSVEILVEGGGDINVQDNTGRTPLHNAVRQRETKTAAILVQAGCDKSILDNEGKSPFDYASDEFKEEFEVLVSQSKATKAFTFPKMNDVKEFGKLMSKGTYSSFTNIVYLGGACNVGKSTLASILMGKAIPLTWHSTDGLHIFFGCFGIELETREMIPVSKVPGNSEILASVLLGQPGVETPTSEEPEITIPSHDKVKDETKSEGLSTVQRGVKKQSQDTKTSPIKITQKLPAKSYATIRDDIKEELKKGTYKVKIAPSDLVDFGGQRSFDMTHQLFIRQKGVFVLMLDGRKNLHDILEEYPQGDITTASILLHWVNSILTYCGVDDYDILPLIIFVATHSDSFTEEEKLESRKLELTQEITALFDKHEHRQRILYDSLYFINGMDKSDVGITNLKTKLVDVAFKQKSWGQKMPMAWVPLELQISEMRADGINLVSAEELSNLNAANAEMALSEKQLKHFLQSQHSLGRIVYFDLPGLQSFIIIQPRALVDILRSVITDEMFWPEDPTLNKILRDLTNFGRITKQDLFRVWSQEQFNKYLPTDGIKEFIAKVLVQLDILVQPKRYKVLEASTKEFLVPCIVNRKHTMADYDLVEGRTICLSYKLVKSDFPSALSYKLIGALLNLWPIKETNQGVCLFHKAAILCIDRSNELYVSMTQKHVIIHLTNADSKFMISRDITSIVQECVSVTLEKVLEFYHTSFGQTNVFDPSNLFEIEMGEICHGGYCLISHSKAIKQSEQGEWECVHKEKHKTDIPLYWFHKKELKECSPQCKGLNEEHLKCAPSYKHLVRLAVLITQKFDEFVINLDLDRNEWQEIVNQDNGLNLCISKFKALCKCRMRKEENLEELEFDDLSRALNNIGYSTHQLCKIFREDVKIHDIAKVNLQEKPDDAVLGELSKRIGNCAMHLGVELELELTTIENIIYQNSKGIFEQNLAILLEWKSTGHNKTIHFLMKALQRADARGLTFLIKKYK